MGVGNPLLKTWSEEDSVLYKPNTYFIDLSYEDEEIQKFNEEEINEGEKEKDKDYWEEQNYDYFVNDELSNILSELEIFSILKIYGNRNIDELSASFRGRGTVLEATNNLLIVTCGGEINHFSFGFIPNFKYDDIYEEFNDLHSDKEEWYQTRNLSFYDRIVSLTEKEYEKRLKKFYYEKYSILDKIFEYNKDKISLRNGPWNSSLINEDYKKEIKQNIKKYKRWK
jgi:hypothetical protein